MKEKIIFLVSIILSGILGWTLGFLRLPYLEKDYSFFLGFMACLASIILCFLILKIWKKSMYFSTPSSTTSSSKTFTKSYSFLWLFVTTTIVIGSLVSSYLFFQQYQFSKNQLSHLDQQTANQFELMASTRRSNSLILMNNLYDEINAELKNSPDRKLSTQTIERIATLNHSFEPYRYLKNGQLSEKKWSPERGQLLLILIKMNIDSSSFNQIKKATSFLGADLREADLTGANLDYINLRDANLTNINLVGASLRKANLEKAFFQNANLSKTILDEANLKDAHMTWTNLQSASLKKVILSNANLSNAILREVDLSEADLRWCKMIQANLTNANLSNSNLVEGDLSKANLEFSNLTKANLITAVLIDTHLKQANFTDAKVLALKIRDKNWIDQLIRWQVVGAEKIQQEFTVGNDALPYFEYKLIPIKK